MSTGKMSERRRGLDAVAPLQPAFRETGSDPLRRKERDAVRMAQVLKAVAQAKEERRRDFLQRRGAPYPAPRPSWAQEQDRQAFNADWRAEHDHARGAAQAQQPSRPDTTAPAQSGSQNTDRASAREAFKAQRREERRQQAQTRGMERGVDQGPPARPSPARSSPEPEARKDKNVGQPSRQASRPRHDRL